MGQVGRPLPQAQPPMPAPTAPLLTSTTCRFSSISRTSCSAMRGHALVIERAVLVRQHARAHFDHDGPRRSGNFLANGIEHTGSDRRSEVRLDVASHSSQ